MPRPPSVRPGFRPFRPLALAAVLVALGAAPAASQTCSALPVGTDELWLGAGTWRGAEAGAGEARFAFSGFGRVALAGAIQRGGYDVETGPQGLALRLGWLFGIPGARGCAWVGSEELTYDFRDRFELDRGKVTHRVRDFGVRIRRPLARPAGVEVAVGAGAGLAHATWDLKGRRLVVQDSLWAEERHARRAGWRFVGAGEVSVRWGRVGAAAGVARRPTLDDAWLGFLRVGVSVVALGGGG